MRKKELEIYQVRQLTPLDIMATYPKSGHVLLYITFGPFDSEIKCLQVIHLPHEFYFMSSNNNAIQASTSIIKQ